MHAYLRYKRTIINFYIDDLARDRIINLNLVFVERYARAFWVESIALISSSPFRSLTIVNSGPV